jgi:hypothetical protein
MGLIMNNKEQFDFCIKIGLLNQDSDVERVKLLADRLLESLYKPCVTDYGQFMPDHQRIKKLGIDKNEPINWGDLSSSVEKKGDCYIVTIEEASPGDCPSLCDYIEKYLKAWGWNAEVKTEW